MMEEQSGADSSFLGTGWAFPPAFDNAADSHRLLLSRGVDNINQSINLLLNTAQGSRSMQPAYGSSLAAFLFQRLDATLQGDIVQTVKLTLLNGEPRIVVESVAVSGAANAGTINIRIAYQIKLTNTRHNYVFPFSLIEATNLDVGG